MTTPAPFTTPSGPRLTRIELARRVRGRRRPSRYVAVVVALTACAACTELTRPAPAESEPARAAVEALTPPPAPPATVQPQPEPRAADTERIAVSHILIAYRGAERARPTVTRSRDDARQLAQLIKEDAEKPGTDFATLAQRVSDSPSGVAGGALPKLARHEVVKAFGDAAFGLKPGELSGVVETSFGFHIIKRTE